MTESQLKAASNKVLCTVSRIQPLTPTVQQVILTPKAPVEFNALPAPLVLPLKANQRWSCKLAALSPTITPVRP